MSVDVQAGIKKCKCARTQSLDFSFFEAQSMHMFKVMETGPRKRSATAPKDWTFPQRHKLLGAQDSVTVAPINFVLEERWQRRPPPILWTGPQLRDREREEIIWACSGNVWSRTSLSVWVLSRHTRSVWSLTNGGSLLTHKVPYFPFLSLPGPRLFVFLLVMPWPGERKEKIEGTLSTSLHFHF